MWKSGLMFLVTAIMLSWSALAGEVYYYVDENGVYHFSDQRKDYKYDKMLIWKDGEFEARKVVLSDEYTSIIEAACKLYNVEPALVKAMVRAESDFKKYAVSRAGAQGLMQLMPETSRKFRIDDPFNPRDNIFAGTALMKALLTKYEEDLNLALAAYNAGEGAVEKHNGIPPYSETQNYIKRVLEYRDEYRELEKPDLQKESEEKAKE